MNLLENTSLDQPSQKILCDLLKEDTEINRYLVLPLLKYYYENSKDEELEELLMEISEKKVD